MQRAGCLFTYGNLREGANKSIFETGRLFPFILNLASNNENGCFKIKVFNQFNIFQKPFNISWQQKINNITILSPRNNDMS